MQHALGRPSAALGIAAIGVMWGASFLFTRVALFGFTFPQVTFLRLAIAAAIVVAVTTVFGGGRDWTTLRDVPLWVLLGLGLFNAAIPYGLITFAQQGVSSSTAAVYNATVPILTIVITVLTRREPCPGFLRGAGVVVGFVGILLLSGFTVDAFDLWTLALFGAALSYATGFVLAAHPSARGASGLALAASQLVIGTLAISPMLAFVGATSMFEVSGESWAAAVALGAVSTALPAMLFYWLVREVGSTRASLVTYVVPLVGLGLGSSVLGEQLEMHTLIGVAVVLLGLTITRIGDATRRRKE